mmetsp:Transcript_145212/g.253438  ORF Transcript_145212/g.253438 Transcript_145212/m.253438 type:complete len:212 (-) Transcript_145212:147-782(-)
MPGHLPTMHWWDVGWILSWGAIKPLALISHAVRTMKLSNDPLCLMPPEDEQISVGLAVNRRPHIGWQDTSDINAVHLFTASSADLKLATCAGIGEVGHAEHAGLRVLLSFPARYRHTILIIWISLFQLVDELSNLRKLRNVLCTLGATDWALERRADSQCLHEAVSAEDMPVTASSDRFTIELVAHGALPFAGDRASIDTRVHLRGLRWHG